MMYEQYQQYQQENASDSMKINFDGVLRHDAKKGRGLKPTRQERKSMVQSRKFKRNNR